MHRAAAQANSPNAVASSPPMRPHDRPPVPHERYHDRIGLLASNGDHRGDARPSPRLATTGGEPRKASASPRCPTRTSASRERNALPSLPAGGGRGAAGGVVPNYGAARTGNARFTATTPPSGRSVR